MEILPSKFRSPPPKPPRRRHSDQLAISSSGTYPSSRKKHQDEIKANSKGVLVQSEDALSGCGSLPANWVADFTSDKPYRSVFKSSYSTSHLNQTFSSTQMPLCSNLESHDSSPDGDRGSCKKDSNLDRTIKSGNTYFEQINSVFLANPRETSAFNNMEGTENLSFSDSISNNSKENHRRHHSDPTLRYEDNNSSVKDGIDREPLSRCSLDAISLPTRNKRFSDSSITSSAYKETQHLYEEVKTLKEINNKLWQQLCLSQSSLEEVQKNSENPCELSLSDLLSSLYYLQRAKDAAMEDRMKVIVEERDTAVQDLEDMIQIITQSLEEESIQGESYSEDIKSLLKEIEETCNPSKLIHQQRLLLTHIYRSKELKQDKLLHQLKLITSDRDNLIEKVKCLEEEMKCLKVSNDVWNTDNKHWENNLLNILCQVIHQRDVALSQINVKKNVENIKCRSAEDEYAIAVEELAKGYEYFQRCNDVKFDAVKRKFVTPHSDAKKCDLFYKDSASDEIAQLKAEIAVLSKALEMEVEKREHVEDKCMRLERLVTVLQKKVNGQNVGIHV